MENNNQNTLNKKKGYRFSKEIKDEILRKIKEGNTSVNDASKNYGVSTQTIYTWLTKGASGNPSWSEVSRLKKENKMLLELVGEITVKLSQSQKKSSA